jgi:uncharacterized YigZ family protein
MDKTGDFYKTIAKTTEGVIFKDRGSKFLGYAFPVGSEEAIEKCLKKVQDEHPQANHWCYAWRLGKNYEHYRVNDDGEPSNSAGMPIYGQIQAFELTEVFIVVVRYFGGTKLGVGGLITAYKTTAAETLKKAKTLKRTIKKQVEIIYEYDDTSKIRALINREKPEIISEEFGVKCKIIMGIPVSKVKGFKERFNGWKNANARILD